MLLQSLLNRLGFRFQIRILDYVKRSVQNVLVNTTYIFSDNSLSSIKRIKIRYFYRTCQIMLIVISF